MMQKESNKHQIYTVRMWRESADDGWRFMIQPIRDPTSAHGFSSPDAVASYLYDQMNYSLIADHPA